MHEVLGYLEKSKSKRKDFNSMRIIMLVEYWRKKRKRQWFGSVSVVNIRENHNHETVVDMISPPHSPHTSWLYYPETYRFYHSSKVLQRGSLFLSRQTILCYCLHECSHGMEARNKLSKRCMGKKSISAIYPEAKFLRNNAVFLRDSLICWHTWLCMLEYLDNGVTVIEQCDFFCP